jgi:hypothetical protein
MPDIKINSHSRQRIFNVLPKRKDRDIFSWFHFGLCNEVTTNVTSSHYRINKLPIEVAEIKTSWNQKVFAERKQLLQILFS